jgi:sugar phosphate isomerase/epimerase
MQPREADASALALLDLPGELASRGYDVMQLCHFHLPSRDPTYLDELRAALTAAHVTLDALLIDSGDLVHPTDADEHEAWIAGWLEDAGALGATRGRVIAGQADPTPELLQQSARRLRRLAAGAPVRVVTENWMALLPTSTHVHRLLEATAGDIGLLVDLANWAGPDRDTQLASIGAFAETSHAKCTTRADGSLDTDDFRRALAAVTASGFIGPLCFVYDAADPDEWEGLATCRRVTADFPSSDPPDATKPMGGVPAIDQVDCA